MGLQWPLNEPGAIEARRSLFFEQSRCETQTSRFWNKYRIEAVRLTVYTAVRVVWSVSNDGMVALNEGGPSSP